MPRHDRAYGVWHQKSPGGGSTRRKASTRRASGTRKLNGGPVVISTGRKGKR